MHSESLSKAGGQYAESEQIEVLCSFIRFFLHNATLSILCWVFFQPMLKTEWDKHCQRGIVSSGECQKKFTTNSTCVFGEWMHYCRKWVQNNCKNNQNKQWPVLCSYSCCQFLFIYLFRMFYLFLWFDSESKSNWSKNFFKENTH